MFLRQRQSLSRFPFHSNAQRNMAAFDPMVVHDKQMQQIRSTCNVHRPTFPTFPDGCIMSETTPLKSSYTFGVQSTLRVLCPPNRVKSILITSQTEFELFHHKFILPKLYHEKPTLVHFYLNINSPPL